MVSLCSQRLFSTFLQSVAFRSAQISVKNKHPVTELSCHVTFLSVFSQLTVKCPVAAEQLVVIQHNQSRKPVFDVTAASCMLIRGGNLAFSSKQDAQSTTYWLNDKMKKCGVIFFQSVCCKLGG